MYRTSNPEPPPSPPPLPFRFPYTEEEGVGWHCALVCITFTLSAVETCLLLFGAGRDTLTRGALFVALSTAALFTQYRRRPVNNKRPDDEDIRIVPVWILAVATVIGIPVFFGGAWGWGFGVFSHDTGKIPLYMLYWTPFYVGFYRMLDGEKP